MHIASNSKLIFCNISDIVDDVIDYCEQYGEFDFDEDSEVLTLILEEEWVQNWEETYVDFIKDIHSDLPTANIMLTACLFDHDSERMKHFECQYKNDYIRWRDTDWSFEGVIDNDLTYDEFEEEGHMEVAEEDFEEYKHKHSFLDYSDWNYVD